MSRISQHIPGNIRVHDGDPEQLAVGESGKSGMLKMTLRRDKVGRTVLAEQFCAPPLHVQRALHCDEGCPGMAYLYLASTSGGILQGDRHATEILLEEDSAAHVTTQGATRVYGMNANSAVQEISVTLREGAYLEFVPDQIIPYRGSRFYQRTRLNVHESAAMVCSEIIAPGRAAMGESFEYDVCRIRTEAVNERGTRRFADIANIEPGRHSPSSFGVMEGRTVLGTVYVLAQSDDAGAIREGIAGAAPPGTSMGTGTLRGGDGLLVRILGDRTEDVRDAVRGIVAQARRTIVGAPLPAARKG